MVQTAIDLQFRVAERIDAKARAYFGFAVAVYGVAQALLLQPDVRLELDSRAGTVQWLAIAATGLLVAALSATVWALFPRNEADLKSERFRELLERAYDRDDLAAPDGVNLLIGELDRRRLGNIDRNGRLRYVIVVSAVAAGVAIVELVIALQAAVG